MERNDKMKVGIVMGSKSDYPVVERAEKVLTDFGVEFETRIISAHRTPVAAMEFASKAEENGIEVIIAAAGKAAHLEVSWRRLHRCRLSVCRLNPPL